MKAIQIAVELEKQVIEQLMRLGQAASLYWLSEKEEEIVKLLQTLADKDPAKCMYPEFSAEWAEHMPHDEWESDSLRTTMDLLNLVWLLEKTVQFYQQAAKNSPYPSQQFFFSSLSKWKLLLRKRVEGVAKHAHSQLWQELGFSPFAWEIG
ncbi:hypothetical protein [Azotosporobacter soli]|uniref:hypothetical protein n=1 Tax=Azotosporobacter soli TaxID=3055040 RepID=UPI0031FEAD92